MRKYQLLGLVFAVACLFSALMVTSAAFAAFQTAKWLSNGIIVAASVPVETTGGLTFHNLENGGEVLCEGIFDGTVGANGTGTITEVLNAAKVKIAELDETGGTGGIKCTSLKICEAGDAEAWPNGLPFNTVLDLETVAGTLINLIVNAGYTILCLVLGIDILELCTAAPNSLSGGQVVNLTTDVEAVGAISPQGDCNGHSEIGEIVADTGNLTFLTGGQTLAASE